MDILGPDDPIIHLSDHINDTLKGYDGGTVLAALALTITTTIMWAQHKSNVPAGSPLLALRDDLTDLIVDIVRARGAQRES